MSADIDVPRLRQLAVIVRCRSFSKAAESIGISQPALSKSIRSLERMLGAQLLQRGRFGAVPTPFGEALARHADAIDAELRSASEEIDALRAARSGYVRIGCGPSEATRLLPIALHRLRALAPSVSVRVLYGLNESLMPMVRHGEVDFALSSIPNRCHDSDLKQRRVHEDRAAVVARQGHPLVARRRALKPADLTNCNWILATHQELERVALDQVFTDAGLEPPQQAIETSSAILMKTMVMQSDCLTFLPRELIYWEEKAGLLSALDLEVPSWRRVVGITQRARAGISPAANMLIEILQTVGKEFTE